MSKSPLTESGDQLKRVFELFFVFLRLGFTSFGGPIAHLGYFHDEFVTRRKWLSDHTYSDLVALCQFLPGPASSQVGMAIGLSRGGIVGALAAWVGFTLPSAAILTLCALGLTKFSIDINSGWLHGLKIVAVAVVAQAIWVMSQKLCVGPKRVTLALVSAIAVASLPTVIAQIGVIALGGFVGWLIFRDESEALPAVPLQTRVGLGSGALSLGVFVALLFVLPWLARVANLPTVQVFDSFYRVGALVFGGGHVVLPMLKTEVVNPGWVSGDLFLVGYGLAQAIPGPLFAFAAYLGATTSFGEGGGAGAAIYLLAIFLPSFLLIVGVLPYWEKMRKFSHMKAAMSGVNATVVGILLSAFYNPVWTSAIFSFKDFALALFGFLLLVVGRRTSWQVVLVSAALGGVFL